MFEFVPATTPSLVAFLAIVLSVLIALGCAIFYSYRKSGREDAAKMTRVTMFWVVVWLIAFCGAVATGYARENPMPGLPMLLLLVVITSITFAMCPIGAKISHFVPLQYLILFQAFRIPLELVLHEWVEQGVIPKTMTWTGQNYDLYAGVIALIAFPFVRRFRAVGRIANVIGFASLLNVIRIVIFSSPLPFAWNVEPKMQLILQIPYALIGPACVGAALIGHVLVLRVFFRTPFVKPDLPENLEIA
ncbi:hypothetical protein BH10BDE1_BH10BDE1_03090 [soil metagenome]